jgi:nucleoside-diphosphate-sugar epimerase
LADIIAITGATGFAGGHVVDLFKRQGRAMRLLARKGPYDDVETVVGSLEDEDALKRLVADAKAVVHIAGAIAAGDRAGFFAVNAEGTRRIAEAARAAGVKSFIHVSSLAAREPELSDYGASKRAGEDVLTGYGADFDLTILRPPVIYGPGDRSSLPLLAQLTRSVAFLPGAPKSRFSLLHVEDFAAAIAWALDGSPRGVHEIDDGTEGGYAWADVVAIAGKSRGGGIKAVYLPRGLLFAVSVPVAAAARLMGAVPFFSPDKVRQLYHPDWVCRTGGEGFAPRIRFAEGFATTVDWYRAQGWLPGRASADRTGSQAMREKPFHDRT